MAGFLYGEVVNTADNANQFSNGNISGDDDFAQGSGAPGAKTSNAYREYYTSNLGANAPYNFNGAQAGQHFIMWFSSKSKLNPTAGYRLIMGNGSSRGEWYVPPLISELKRNGAFVTRVINPSEPFDRIASGSWSLTGNPAQLTSVSQMGGGLQTIVSIMGSFNNTQIDQLTIGYGIRLFGGTVANPDTFEVARAADEDINVWGWSQQRILKGGIYIGPETGDAASVFNSVRESRIFSASRVAADFYKLTCRGANTDVIIDGANISAEDPDIASWSYIIPVICNSWEDRNSVYSGISLLELQSFTIFENIKISGINNFIQNGCTLKNVIISNSTKLSGEWLIDGGDFALMQNCTFFGSVGTGHLVNVTTSSDISINGLTFVGYGANGSQDSVMRYDGADDINIYLGNDVIGFTYTETSTGTVNIIAQQIAINFTGIPEGLEFRLRLGTKTLAYSNEVIGGTYTFVYSASESDSPVGRTVTITSGGTANDGTHYAPLEILYLLPNSDVSNELIFNINPSYI